VKKFESNRGNTSEKLRECDSGVREKHREQKRKKRRKKASKKEKIISPQQKERTFPPGGRTSWIELQREWEGEVY